MQKWEYMTLSAELDNEFLDKLNRLGEIGWELVTSPSSRGSFNGTFIFKRPIDD